MTPAQKQELAQFYKRCHDEPLDPADSRESRYVPFLERAPNDPIKELASHIVLNPAAGVHLFTGRIGGGKSTELRRLKQVLEAEKCVVFLSDMREYLHQDSPVGIVDFLISIMAGLAEAYEVRYGEALVYGTFWAKFADFLPEFAVKELTLKSKVADVKLVLRDDPTFKERLAKSSEIKKVVQSAQDFTSALVQHAREQEGDPDLKVVYLVDSFELRGKGEDGKNYRSVQDLFTVHGDRLRMPSMDMVYTAPQYLFFLVKGLSTRFGSGPICNVPCIHVFKEGVKTDGASSLKPCDELDEAGGVAIMKEILSKRYPMWRNFFSEGQATDLVRASGGDIREFLLLVGNALAKLRSSLDATLPMPQAVIDSVLDAMRRNYLPIPEDQRAWMAEIRTDRQPHLKSEDSIWPFAQMLDQKLVINYRNGGDWYDIHPLLHGMFPRS